MFACFDVAKFWNKNYGAWLCSLHGHGILTLPGAECWMRGLAGNWVQGWPADWRTGGLCARLLWQGLQLLTSSPHATHQQQSGWRWHYQLKEPGKGEGSYRLTHKGEMLRTADWIIFITVIYLKELFGITYQNIRFYSLLLSDCFSIKYLCSITLSLTLPTKGSVYLSAE